MSGEESITGLAMGAIVGLAANLVVGYLFY